MDSLLSEVHDSARVRRPVVAAVLSFVWPGLGQAYTGRRKRGLALALPPALILVLLAVMAVVLGPLVFALHFLSPLTSLGLIVLIVVLAIWRGYAIVDAARPRHRGAYIVTLLLVGAVALSHGWLANSAWAFYLAGQRIYAPITQGNSAATPSPPASRAPDGSAPTTTSPTPGTTTASPSPTSPLPGASSRVTVLLVGVDNTHGPDRGLTDTLIVASFDPISHSLTMISLPRDTARLPFYGGGEYGPRINTLMQTAARLPDEYPDGPLGTLINEVSYVVGIPIDYYAQIDISGFTQLIDLVGGVDVVLARTINDPGYGFSPTEIGFYLEAGPHHLDGKYATAYVRSRHGSSDYERAQRQQQVVLALRTKLGDPGVLTRLPELLEAVSNIVRTDAPLDRLPEIVSIALGSASAETRNIVLKPPTYAHGVLNAAGQGTFATELNMDAVAQLSIELFGTDSLYADPLRP